MTDEGRPAKPGDPEASLRENLAAQLASARDELSGQLIELRGRGGDAELIGQADAQLGTLLSLKAQLDRASPASLTTISAQIARCVATATDLAQKAQSATSESATRAATELATASEAARARVSGFMTDYYEKRIFDPYLRFGSEQEETEYRQREEARRREIEKAQALGTPAGDLRAINLTIAQLDDAGTHGADRSPEFERLRLQLKTDQDRLASASKVNLPPTVAVDVADTVDAASPVPAELAAAMRSVGVKATDRTAEGHGVATRPRPPTHDLTRLG